MESTPNTRYYVDLKPTKDYICGTGELEKTPFMTGAILLDDSGKPDYERRRYDKMGADAAVGVIGLGRRWRMKDDRRVGKPYSMIVQIEFFDVGVARLEANQSVTIDVDGKPVRAIYGRGELCGRSIRLEFHPKAKDEVGVEEDGKKTTKVEFWHPCFIDVGPKLYNPFMYVRDEESLVFPPENIEAMPAEEFFPYDED